MRKAVTLVTLFSVFLFASCGSESEEKTSPATQTNPTVTSPVSTDANASQPVQQQNTTQNTTTNATTNNTANPVVMPEVKAPAVKSGAGLNPAHGQPGHRCDIPVGAPLDSKPTQPTFTTSSQPNAKPVVTTTPVVTTPSSVTTTVPAPSTGLNPAHGQPGHRCDIAVGAPLNSKPAASAQVIPTTTPVKQ